MPPNTFIIGGHPFIIEALESSLDQEFINLHAAFLGASTCQWSSFTTAAHSFFSTPGITSLQHGQFFSNFTILWRKFLTTGQFDAAEKIWEMACNLAWDWEAEHKSSLIHKGTPYYFWGMTAIQRGDIDRGYALMHQALEEDVRETKEDFPDTPAVAFATMNADKLEQAALWWVKEKVAVANRHLVEYQRSTGNKLDFSSLNARFLQHPPNRYSVYSLSYVLGRLAKLSGVPKHALVNDFAAQLNMELIFRLLQVLESSLKAKNPNGTTFCPLAVYLAKQANLSLEENELSHVNQEGKKNFETTIKKLLDGSFSFPNGTSASRLDRDLAIAYVCRNYGAHQLSPAQTVLLHSEDIRQAVFNVFFVTVETLY